MPPGPFEVDLDKDARRSLARRLRALLERGQLDVREMAAGLEVEPEVVVVALRELRARARRRGRLRSAIRHGHVSWWWEAADRTPPPEATEAVEAVEPAPDAAEPLADETVPPSKKDRRGKKKRDRKGDRKSERGAVGSPAGESEKLKKKGKRKLKKRNETGQETDSAD